MGTGVALKVSLHCTPPVVINELLNGTRFDPHQTTHLYRRELAGLDQLAHESRRAVQFFRGSLVVEEILWLGHANPFALAHGAKSRSFRSTAPYRIAAVP
jgi:hypothetical protein